MVRLTLRILCSVLVVASLNAVTSGAAAAAMRQPVLVPDEFPPPAASRDLEARIHTAIRGPTYLFGDTGDSFRSMRDSAQKGPHRLNDYMRNLRVYARDDGQLEIRFDIVADEGDTFIWPSQVPARLFVRLFDQNGMYLTHFMTKESFAPAESIVRALTTGAMGLINSSPVLLLDSDGKSNVLVYTVNARDLAYARIAEVGFYLRPADTPEMRGVQEVEQWLPQEARRAVVSCTDYMKCIAPDGGLRSPVPNTMSTSAAPVASAPAAEDLFANAEKCRAGLWSFGLRSVNAFEQLFGPIEPSSGEAHPLDKTKVTAFESTPPTCRISARENVLVVKVGGGAAYAVARAADRACSGITLNGEGLDCP